MGRLLARITVAVGCCIVALAQAPQIPTFQSDVNLVFVTVVVRDRHGKAVGNLTKDDFELFDKAIAQTISSFSAVERPGEPRDGNRRPIGTAPGRETPQVGRSNPDTLSDSTARYFIYLFDDLNIRFADMARVRDAAVSHFKNHFTGSDRAAIQTFSGRHSLEFTADWEKLQDGASKLRWEPIVGEGEFQCPDVSYYLADLVVSKADSLALEGLVSHTAECSHAPPVLVKQLAIAAANRELIAGSRDAKLALSAIRRAIRRLSLMQGQRILVLASPGFFAQTPEAIKATAEVLELAARNGVVINGLSARGLIMAPEEEDVAARTVLVGRRAPPRASSPEQLWLHYRRESARADGDVMQDLSDGTGGIFFHNNNDLRVGFERLAAAPEFSYVLGFSPAEFKPDGSFHPLKIRLTKVKGATVEARRGYYALGSDAKDMKTKADIEDAVFSRDETSAIPVVLQTGYSKPKDATVVKVLVVAKLDLRSFRSRDSLDSVVALFDSEGVSVTQTAETLKFIAELDPTVTLRWEFPNIKPGDYVVRIVIREPKSNVMTTVSRGLKVL